MKTWLAILAMLGAATAAQACPTCKESVALTDAAGGAAASSLGTGFGWSIYFMLGGVIVVMGIMARVLMRAIRQG
ncbi:MAG: hypothetical protein IT447_01650 [Phycisphaerales bacterium]|jgi:hypothetical protein|nr:hypothetical protein [Phycisphaerales bacterium]